MDKDNNKPRLEIGGVKLSTATRDLTGQKFAMLTAVKPIKQNKIKQVIWLFKCDCGKEKEILGISVTQGNSKSCGCIVYRKGATTSGYKHGLSRTSIKRAHESMKSRCYNKNSLLYPNYGGRGITVCDRWLEKENGFLNFLKDMGEHPGKLFSLDRTDNELGYSPENCKWANRKEQNNNTRSTIKVTYKGETRSITQWAEKLDLCASTIRQRYHRKEPLDRVFFKGTLSRKRAK